MRLIDADALIEKWYEVNNIGPEDCGARFIGYTEIPRFINKAPTVQPTGNLISKEEAIEAVVCHIWHTPPEARKLFNCENYVRDVVEEAFKRLPSAEAVQGEWIKDYEKNIYKCSVCGCEEVVPTCMGEPTIWKYCPNCGSVISTRMKGGAGK